MAESKMSEEMSLFMKSGIYRFEGSNAIFMDPVRVLNSSYTRFRVSPNAYYSRFFEPQIREKSKSSVNPTKRKRKRKERKSHPLNDREQSADKRHQEARPLLLRAHEAFLGTKDLVSFLCNLKSDFGCSSSIKEGKELLVQCVERDAEELSFVELGSVWQAPLYDISLCFHGRNKPDEDDGGLPLVEYGEREVVPVFNNLVVNETSDDVEAEFLNSKYIIPGECCFFMSGLRRIQDLIPVQSDHGFNLIVIDPPWENRSASQKSVYPMLPNQYLLSLPIKQLTHPEGALVALWMTNREKLRVFIEEKLFPTWGVRQVALFYWLKVKADGSLIGELDLFHHRPYECLLLGYCHGERTDSRQLSTFSPLQDNQIIISIPGDYSRKPPVGKLLQGYVPGLKPARCIELFARELLAGWTSWGNEPLHFQEARYFLNKTKE